VNFLKQASKTNGRLSFGKIPTILELPDLIENQRKSYDWFIKEGMREVFNDIFPIQDFTGNLTLEFLDYSFNDPPKSVDDCRERDMTYAMPLMVKLRLICKEEGKVKDIKEQEIFMGDIPVMTDKGTFIVNGAERVVVSQLVRSPGCYFDVSTDSLGRRIYLGTIIPNRGAWLEFETDAAECIYVRIDKTRKITATTLIKALGYKTNAEVQKVFQDAQPIINTLERDHTKTDEEALIEIYRRLRPGDPPTVDSARQFLTSLFTDPKRYNLAKVGRYKLAKKLGLKIKCQKCGWPNKPGALVCEAPKCKKPLVYEQTLDKSDIVEAVRYLTKLMHGEPGYKTDDIDHLGNRRVKSVGELLQNQFRIGLLRLERVVKERMTVQDISSATPQNSVNIRPVVAALKEFFGSSQLSQFMDQTNCLAELTHKRRLSALGPGGLSRERAGFEVRDVHHSHYGRICPIETPEGPNIGLIGTMATYAKINEFGFITTPYRKVVGGRVTDEVMYLTADEEDEHVIAQANVPFDDKGKILSEKVPARAHGEITMVSPKDVDAMDVSPKQVVSVATSLIPFLEHDDANRALMGANMQRQAVPILKCEAPLVGTGMEYRAAKDSGTLLVSKVSGTVKKVDANSIIIETGKGKEETYKLQKFQRSNAGTCLNQRPLVKKGDVVKAGQVLADGASSVDGELALGKNILVGFMPWEGYNYEDAILISSELVEEDSYTSIHIEEYECEARDTKLGPEEITRDIPNVGDDALKDLDERGIVRVGAEVVSEDILVGKVTPKGETELTAEERLLRAIFGEKARDVRDTSLRVPHGEKGKVIGVKVFSREQGDELSPGVNKLVRVFVALKRKIMQGDKMSGRHGNKGVIAKILPKEDMPFLPDGTPLQIVLNPLGVPSRMNIGQILETQLGLAAHLLGLKVECPVFDGAKEPEMLDLMEKGFRHQIQEWEKEGYSKHDIVMILGKRIGKKTQDLVQIAKPKAKPEELKDVLIEDLTEAECDRIIEEAIQFSLTSKTFLYDGRTGLPFENPVMVGYIYMLKLAHLVDDKIHARSTGPYSLVTQQPLGGKAQFGGQRFGEMEVWALEAYGAAHTLQELLTVKSDDVVGRVKTYEAIVRGENVMEPGIPESFKVLIKELQSLCLDIKILTEEQKEIEIKGEEEDVRTAAKELGLDIGESVLSNM
jgi:DNA-directed RNA polymerase subunit beta